MSKQKRKGYNLEKKTAEYFDGQRRGTLGKEDVNHSILSIECKVKNPIPSSVKKDYSQAVRNAPTDKTPIVLWKPDGAHMDDAIVIINAMHFRSILSGLCKCNQ